MGDQEVKPEEIIQAEQYIEEGEFDKALELLSILDKKNGIPNHKKLSYFHLRGQLLIWQAKYKEAIKILEEMYRISQLYDCRLHSIDALVLLSHIYTYTFQDDKALKIIEQAKNLLKKLSQESSEVLLAREAHLIYCQGLIFYHKSDLTQALEYLERSANLREPLGNKQELAESLYSYGRILAREGKIVRALGYVERSLALATESNNLFYKGLSYNTIGVIYLFKGKINRCLTNLEKSLAIFKKIKNLFVIGGVFVNLSEAYYLKGEMTRALDYLEKSLEIDKEIDVEHLKISSLDTGIHFALEINDINRAREYFQDIERIHDLEDSEETDFIYLYNKALLLKSSSLKSDQIRAKEILTELVGKGIPFVFETTVRALLHLCDILLTEFHDSSNIQLLDQIQIYIRQILDIAKHQKLKWLLVESYLLEAKFDFIVLDLKKAQQSLNGAQDIAEKYSMIRPIERILQEQDILLNQIKKYQVLKDSNKAILELSNLTPLKEQIQYMLKKRLILKSL
ncbi:MAG: tetratricopeptide repeat protein [Candidatus Hodarchaeota archaeon]